MGRPRSVSAAAICLRPGRTGRLCAGHQLEGYAPINVPRSTGTEDRLFDVAQAILAKENILADKESRRTKGAARYRLLGIAQQAFFDRGVLDTLERACPVE